MIGWRGKPKENAEPEETGGFDAFETRLGDIMRGERATMGKSLLDVQRELKIKAAYIAAIEHSDPSAFETQGFIAGYVRSYARYLGMDPDQTFRTFCRESGFTPAHGMSEAASIKKPRKPEPESDRDRFVSPATPFTPENDPIFASVEPRAVGSIAVLVALIAALGYGGWSILQEVQRVEFAPLDQTPQVMADLDPLAGGAQVASAKRPSAEAFDRLYRPATLDLPVMEPRDAPIATLMPRRAAPVADMASPDPAPRLADAQDVKLDAPVVQVTADPAPGVSLLAVRPVWVRVRAADGSVIFEKILDAGEEYAIPSSETPPTLHAGNSGSLFFKVGGQVYGPAGSGTSVAKDVALGSSDLRDVYALADPGADAALADYVTFAQAETAPITEIER